MLLSLLNTLNVFSQDILWEKSLGGKDAEYLFDAIPTPDYGFILAGSSTSSKSGNKYDSNKGSLDYCIWKMNEKGDLEWQKTFGGSGIDILQNVKLTKDAGFILAGISNSTKDGDKREKNKGESDFWVLKLDAKGNEIWQKTIGGSSQENLETILQTSDGGYLLGGTSNSNKYDNASSVEKDYFNKTDDCRGGLDYWIIKLGAEGNIEWQKTYGGNYNDELRSIVVTKDGNYLVAGYSNSSISGDKKEDSFGLGDYWVLMLNTKGNIIWQRTIGSKQDDNLSTVIQLNAGGFMLGGSSNSESSSLKEKGSSNGSDFWLVKIDDSGNILWENSYDYGKEDILTSIIENEDSSLLIGGYVKTEIDHNNPASRQKNKTDKEGINDYIALKIDQKGEIFWEKSVGSKGEEVLKVAFETRDGGYLFAGTSKGNPSRDKESNIGDGDFWIVKVKDKTKPKKKVITIEAMPNPASSFTNIIVNFEYQRGTATLYDLNGRKLKEIEISGERTIPVELSNYPQGIYVVDIQTNTNHEAIKVIKK